MPSSASETSPLATTAAPADGETAPRPQRRSRAKDAANRKRAVYVGKACSVCRARKIRCDGGQPCSPCQRRAFDCLYQGNESSLRSSRGSAAKDSDRIATNPISLKELTNLVSSLQRKVAVLESGQRANSEATTADPETGTIDEIEPSLEDELQSSAHATTPGFAGPSSADFGFGIARVLVEQETGGYDGSSRPTPDSDTSSVSYSDEEFDIPLRYSSMSIPITHNIDTGEAFRLVDVYSDGIGAMHPIVNLDAVRDQLEILSARLGTIPLISATDVRKAAYDADMKMVIAIALLSESGGANAVASEIFDSLHSTIADHALVRGYSLRGTTLLLLCALYHIYQVDLPLASRYVSIALRSMIEAGLHRKQVLQRRYSSQVDQNRAIVALFTAMVLDRQLNFNAGLPFVLKDADIEIPSTGGLPAYLQAMVTYVRLDPSVWSFLNNNSSKMDLLTRQEFLDRMDKNVDHWVDSLQDHLRPGPVRNAASTADHVVAPQYDRPTQLQRCVLYLRANQFKIVVLRPLLFSHKIASPDENRIQQLAQLSSDTACLIAAMNQRFDLYRENQAVLSPFLSSALSSVLLIHIHNTRMGPAEGGGQQPSQQSLMVKDGISKALELIRSYSSSKCSQQLQKNLAGLQGILGRYENPVSQASGYVEEATAANDASSASHLYHNVSDVSLQNNLLSEENFGAYWNFFVPGFESMIEDPRLLAETFFQPQDSFDGASPLQFFENMHWRFDDLGTMTSEPQ